MPASDIAVSATYNAANAGDFICTTNSDNTITITNYIGSGGAVNIPGVINGLPVTIIGSSAFQSCTNLTSVTIPDSVTRINGSAFFNCTSLTGVTISSNVTSIAMTAFNRCTSMSAITVDALNPSFSSADGVLFNKSQTMLITYPRGKAGGYTIPDSVTSIGAQAFAFCINLTGVTIGSNVTSIGNAVFFNCTNLTAFMVDVLNSAYISVDGVLFDKNQTILFAYPGGKAGSFYTITNNVTSLKGYSFSGCTSLTSVTIPASVTNIEVQAFVSCTNLTEVYFHGNAPGLGTDVFLNDNNATIYYLAGTTDWTNPWAGRPTVLWQLDSDADGIPDSWEQQYFEGATNANPNATCSNGFNTVREAYIAGLNPNDPQSRLLISDFRSLPDGKTLGWTAVSGRVYSVYWTSNLMTGFQCLESNIPWTQGEFTNSTAVPCGYYKIGVQLP
jgi:hypothetical protein